MEKKILWGKTSVLVIHSNKKIRRLFQHLMFLLILSKSGLTFKWSLTIWRKHLYLGIWYCQLGKKGVECGLIPWFLRYQNNWFFTNLLVKSSLIFVRKFYEIKYSLSWVLVDTVIYHQCINVFCVLEQRTKCCQPVWCWNYNVFQGLVVHEKVGWAPLSGPIFKGKTLWNHPIMPFDEVIQSCYPINKWFSKGRFVKKHE